MKPTPISKDERTVTIPNQKSGVACHPAVRIDCVADLQLAIQPIQ
jgi:hypothetical protein